MEQVIKNEQTVEEYNNALVKNLGEFSNEFNSFAESVNRVFYFYIQTCIQKKDEMLLDQADVYNIYEVVEFLRKLKYEKYSNH